MGTTVYQYYHCRPARTDEKYTPDVKFRPERMTDKVLKHRLCSAGPDLCGKCQGCGFGKEWLRRHPEGGGEK